jgi:hypothetical protein
MKTTSNGVKTRMEIGGIETPELLIGVNGLTNRNLYYD